MRITIAWSVESIFHWLSRRKLVPALAVPKLRSRAETLLLSWDTCDFVLFFSLYVRSVISILVITDGTCCSLQVAT